MNAFQEEIEFKGDAEPQVQAVCLRGFSCRSGKLSERSKSGRKLPGGKGVDTFNGLGQCFYTCKTLRTEPDIHGKLLIMG